MVVGRFAPSPTGRMHLGNLMAALMSWLSVRRQGGRWILRIEDLDPQRSRLGYARVIEDDLHWLGLDWDEGGVDGIGPSGPYCQSQRGEIYGATLRRLLDTGLCYPCTCTRADLRAAAGAPHASDHIAVYPGTCRPRVLPARWHEPAAPASVRLAVPDRDITFSDRLCGPQTFNLARDCGDFVLRRADGAWAYQLAVVVDDALMGVTEVVRGVDLLDSVPRQMYLYELLGYQPPEWCHIPLLCAPDGRRLSKRDTSQAMDQLRLRYTPAALLGHLARLAGLVPDDSPLTPAELLARVG